MSTRDLINAIAAGDALEIENAFNSVMAEKVSARIDDMRIDVAQNLFAEQAEEIEEEQLDELKNSTLTAYAFKATKQAPHLANKIDKSTGSEKEKLIHKARKRFAGFQSAGKRLSKSDNPVFNTIGKAISSASNTLKNEEIEEEQLDGFAAKIGATK